MLTIQIAAGIVLAVVVLRFWRQSLLAAVGLLALAILLVGLLLAWQWFDGTAIAHAPVSPWLTVVIAAPFWSWVIVRGLRQQRRKAAPVVHDGTPPS